MRALNADDIPQQCVGCGGHVCVFGAIYWRCKDIEFLSNRELVEIFRSVLNELDIVASAGAHRATTYLAVSPIEGIFGEIVKLLDIGPSTVPSVC